VTAQATAGPLRDGRGGRRLRRRRLGGPYVTGARTPGGNSTH
jgi:hypothetical protein